MGVGGVWTLSSLCTCQACSEVCEKMSSLWMCYTQICPRFECRDEHTIHTCVYCVLTLNAGTGRVCVAGWGVCVCVCVCVSYLDILTLMHASKGILNLPTSRLHHFVSYHIGDTPLETISTHKHLGIVLSSNLEWGPNVDEVTSKAERLLGFIRSTVGSNDPVTMKKLFVALVRPIIEYCAPL